MFRSIFGGGGGDAQSLQGSSLAEVLAAAFTAADGNVDAATLETLSLAAVLAAAVSAADTALDGTVDAGTLGGSNLAAVIASAQTGVNATQLQGSSLSAVLAAALAASKSALIDPSVNGGRASISSSDSEAVSDTPATTLHFIPHSGNKIALWDGSAWDYYEISSLSLANTANDLNNTAQLTNGYGYDLVCYVSGGSAALGAWRWTDTDDRDDAMVITDGVRHVSGAKTHRIVASFVMIDDGGTKKFVNAKRQRYVSNVENRVPFCDYLTADGDANYNTASEVTPRRINNNSSVTAAYRDAFLASLFAAIPDRAYGARFRAYGAYSSGGSWEGYMVLDGNPPTQPGKAILGGSYHFDFERSDNLDAGLHSHEAYEVPNGVATIAIEDYASMLVWGEW